MDLFPTFVEAYDLTSFIEEVGSFHDVVMNAIEENKNSQHSLAVNGRSSHGGYDPLADPKSRPLLEIFRSCVEDYSAKVMSCPTLITAGWYNVLPPGGFTKRHRHECSVVSGAFYVKLPEKSGNLYFVSPLQQYRMCEMYLEPNWYQQYEAEMHLQESWLYLFPSWLEHGSRVNESEEDRVTVSFNTYLNNDSKSERFQDYMKRIGYVNY